MLAYALLPIEGVFLYKTLEGSILEFSKKSQEKIASSIQQVNETIVAKFGKNAKKAGISFIRGASGALDLTVKMLLRAAITHMRRAASFSCDNFAAETITQLTFDSRLTAELVKLADSATNYISKKIW